MLDKLIEAVIFDMDGLLIDTEAVDALGAGVRLKAAEANEVEAALDLTDA